MAEPKGKSGSLALVFGGGGKDAAPGGGPSGDEAEGLDSLDELAEGLAETDGDSMAPEAMPPDFAVHASEAFPELADDEGRLEALYRTIKACHPAV